MGYRHPPRVGKDKQAKVAAAPPAVRAIAWKAQHRLDARYRTLTRKGKRKTVAITAMARELAAFIWAVAHEVANTAGVEAQQGIRGEKGPALQSSHNSQGAAGRRSQSGNHQTSCKGGGEATAGGIPVIALWPMLNIDARPKTGNSPKTDIRFCG